MAVVRYLILVVGYLILNTRYLMLDSGCWTKQAILRRFKRRFFWGNGNGCDILSYCNTGNNVNNLWIKGIAWYGLVDLNAVAGWRGGILRSYFNIGGYKR